jgi:hypothetical protein
MCLLQRCRCCVCSVELDESFHAVTVDIVGFRICERAGLKPGLQFQNDDQRLQRYKGRLRINGSLLPKAVIRTLSMPQELGCAVAAT